MKTPGQVLYEYKNPKYLTVVEITDVFKTRPFVVQNPKHVVEWSCLTSACKDTYEKQAKGHFIFSEASS